MKDYLFILGRDRDLSFLEIISYFKARKIYFSIKVFKENVLLLNLNEIDFNKVITDLGGTIKIAEIISEGNEVEDNLDKIQINFSEKKLLFSLGMYGNSNMFKRVNDYFKKMPKKEKEALAKRWDDIMKGRIVK